MELEEPGDFGQLEHGAEPFIAGAIVARGIRSCISFHRVIRFHFKNWPGRASPQSPFPETTDTDLGTLPDPPNCCDRGARRLRDALPVTAPTTDA